MARYRDVTIYEDAKKFSKEYADLAALSYRQTMAAIEFARRRDLPPNEVPSYLGAPKDVYAYMKDVGVSKCVLAEELAIILSNADTVPYLS